MLPSFFRPEERKLILSYLDEWERLKGSPKTEDEEGDLCSPKDQLIDQIIAALFLQFPERDLSGGTNGPLVWAQEDRDKLHGRVRQLLYNAVYKRKAKSTGVPYNPLRYVSTLIRFKQRYAQQILERRNELRASESNKDSLSAYNVAVRELFAKLQKERPEEYEALEDTVAQLKSNLRQSHDEQPEDVRNAVQEMLPGEIVTAVKSWERRSGAKVYVTALWANSGGGQTAFDYASSNCGKYLKSTLGDEIREKWLDYMKDDIGDTDGNTSEAAAPAVYPNIDGWPMLPDLDTLKLPMAEEKVLLRRYFTTTSLAMGGTQPSYQRIGDALEKSPGSYIEEARMPANLPKFRDLKHWTRAEIQAWTMHILGGQRGLLPPERRFGWRIVPRPLGEPVRIEPNFRPVLAVGASVRWTRAELQYAEQTRKDRPPQGPGNQWKGLPLARTSHIYSPYTGTLYQELLQIHQDEDAFISLLQEAARMEQLGPLHCAETIGDISQDPNPHIPGTGMPSLARNLTPAEWLPNAFFDPMHHEHRAWSLSSLKEWLTTHRPHIHQESMSVYGGPLGVRNIVFALSRISQNVANLRDSHEIPSELQTCLHRLGESWSPAKARRLLDECVRVIHADISRSNDILRATLDERAEAWERAIEDAEMATIAPGAPIDSAEIGITATSGVPRSSRTLQSMLATVRSRRKESSDNAGDHEVSVIIEERLRGPEPAPASRSGPSEGHAETVAAHKDDDEDPDLARLFDRSELNELQPGAPVSPTAHRDPSVDVGQSEVPAISPEEEEAQPVLRRRKSARKSVRRPEVEDAIRVLQKGRARRGET